MNDNLCVSSSSLSTKNCVCLFHKRNQNFELTPKIWWNISFIETEPNVKERRIRKYRVNRKKTLLLLLHTLARYAFATTPEFKMLMCWGLTTTKPLITRKQKRSGSFSLDWSVHIATIVCSCIHAHSQSGANKYTLRSYTQRNGSRARARARRQRRKGNICLCVCVCDWISECVQTYTLRVATATVVVARRYCC